MLKILVLMSIFISSMAFEDQDILDMFVIHDKELQVFLKETADLSIYNIRHIGNGYQKMTDLSSNFLRKIGKIMDDFTKEINSEVVKQIFYSLDELNLSEIYKLPEMMDSIYPICRSAIKDFIIKSQIIPTICSFFKQAEYDENETLRIQRETSIQKSASDLISEKCIKIPEVENKTRNVYKLKKNHEEIIDNLFRGMVESLNDIQSDIINDIHNNIVIQMHKSGLISF